MEEVPTAKRQPAGFEPSLTLKESFKVFADEPENGFTQHQVIPRRPADPLMASPKHVQVRPIALRADSLYELEQCWRTFAIDQHTITGLFNVLAGSRDGDA